MGVGNYGCRSGANVAEHNGDRVRLLRSTLLQGRYIQYRLQGPALINAEKDKTRISIDINGDAYVDLDPPRTTTPSKLKLDSISGVANMARKAIQTDQIVKLIVGAGQASPSPPVGPALGSKGVKSMDFCKEFNARTAHLTPGVPIPARVTVRPDRSFHFELRTPTTSYLLLQAAGVKERKGKMRGSMQPGKEIVGEVSLKHIYDIAKIKHSELRLSGFSLEALAKSVIASAKSTGIAVVP